MSAIGDGKNAVVTVPMNSAATVQPPSGDEWLLRDIATALSNTGGWPKGASVGLYDGSNYSIIRSDTGGPWQRKLGAFLTHSIYLRIVDTDATADTIAYSAIVTSVSGTAAGRSDAKVAVSSVAASAYMTVQPSAGQAWSMTEAGSDKLSVTGTGDFPNIEVSLYDGVNTLYVVQVNAASFTRPWNAILTNSVYGRIQNKDAATAILSYSAVRMS